MGVFVIRYVRTPMPIVLYEKTSSHVEGAHQLTLLRELDTHMVIQKGGGFRMLSEHIFGYLMACDGWLQSSYILLISR